MPRPIALLPVLLLALAALPLVAEEPAPVAPVAKHFEAGRKAEAARDFKTALVEYEKAVDLDVDHEDVVERWEACERLAQWQDTVEGKPMAMDLVRLGEVYAVIGRIQEEVAVYEEAIELDPSCTDAHGHLALAHYNPGRRFAGRSLVTVIFETERFLEASPYRERLEKARADFLVYGRLRIFDAILREEIGAARKAQRDGDPTKAAGIYRETAKKEIPDAYRTRLHRFAGEALLAAGDVAGAREAFAESLRHAATSDTLRVRLRLAAMDAKDGRLATALDHLEAAVAEGSWACDAIERGKEGVYAPLFAAEDPAIRKALRRLLDPEAADAPIRAEIAAAVTRAKEEKKLVLLHWYGPYCPFVMAMEERLAHPEVRKLLEAKFVHVRMNQGGMHKGLTLDREFGGVMAEHGVPAFFVLDTDGSIHSIRKDRDLFNPSTRCYDVEKIVEWLESIDVE